MKNLTEKVCRHCGKSYQPTGSCSKTCSKECYKEYSKAQRKINRDNYYLRKGCKVGVGKGGATGFGKDNPYYKNGIGIFANARKQIKEELRYCQFCGKDLILATRHEWCVHHIDHDRTNNEPSNWTLICKKCHQIEHKCWLALQGSTTRVVRLPNGRFAKYTRSPQESGETPDTLTSNAVGGDIV